MPRSFCEAISQISQVFTGSNCNNCIGQVQNAYLQEIIQSCSVFQQLPILQSKEVQQFQLFSSSIPGQKLIVRGETPTLRFFSNLNSSISDALLTFLFNFSSKVPLFDRRINQEAQSFFLKLKALSEVNPKKLAISGNKENSNSNNYSYTTSPSSFPQAESDTIARITLSTFLSFIHYIVAYKSKNLKNSNNQSEQAKGDENNANLYFFDMQLYSILFNLFILSIQLNPPKDQIIDSLKSAVIILFEIFISESFKQYNLVFPPPKKILSRITINPSQNDGEQMPQKEEETKSIDKKDLIFDKDEFCSIMNNIQSLFISKSSFFFPGLDAILVGIEKHISSDHRSELHFFDKEIIKFITHLASNVRASLFSQDSTRSLILLASNQLLKFDKDSLDYFIALSKHNDDASNTQIVMMLVNSLTIELPKERITNADSCILKLTSMINKSNPKKKEDNENDSTDISLFPTNNYLNESFCQPDTKIIIDLIVNNYLYANEQTDDKNSPSFTPFVQEGYSTLVSKRIYKIISILSESFRRSTAMLDKLYTTFGKAIANSSSLFDSLCLFVVFYLESKSKWHFDPSTNPAVFLLLRHLFSRNILAKKKTIVQRLQMFAIGILIDKGETYLLNILNEIAESYNKNIDNIELAENSNKTKSNENNENSSNSKPNPSNKSSNSNKNETNSISLPTSPLYILQILEGLIVNYKKLIILLTNSSDSILEPLCKIMDKMKKISFDTNYVSYYNVTYKDINGSKDETENNNNNSDTIKTNTPNYQRDVDRVRYTFLILVSLISENNEARKILIDNISFTKTFLDFVFEGEKVRDYIISQLESALMNSKCDPSIAFIPNVSKIFESIICQSKNEKEKDYLDKTFILSKEIFSMINRTISNRKEMSKNFSICSKTIFQMILYVKESSSSSFFENENLNDSLDSLPPNLSLFHELLEFLSRISIHLQITEQDKEIIRESIISFWPSQPEGKKLPTWLYYSLIKLMVPDEKLIRQPILLHLIFDNFNNDEYLKFLCDLLDNNFFNVDKCCSVSFDQTIFQELISDPLNFENKTLIKKLFTNISLISISPSVVYQYLRLLSPKEGTYHLNENMNLYLNYLNELFILSLETQHESWALNPGHSQKPVLIDLSSKMALPKSSPKRTVNSYGNGYFTFVFWLIVKEMSPTYFPLIFSAKDEKGNIYEVFIRGRKIFINSDKSHYSSSKEFNYTFNKDEWYFVSLSFSKQEENENQNFCIVSMTVNEMKDQKIEVKFPLSQMLTGLITFTFGGVLHDYSIKATNPCLLGPFALFNMLLRNDKILSLYKQEQRFFCRDVKDPSLCHVYQPYAYGPRTMQKNFASTIVLNIKLEVFVPLFLLIPMKFDDGTFYENYVEILINIIKHGLNFGSTVEDSFYNANGFGIISFILSQKKFQKYCDYSLYCHFYNLFLNLMTEKLKTQMIKTILLNFNLWSRIEKAEEMVQIFDNWLNALFPNNLLIISKIYSFSSLLNMIIFNFCLKEDEHLIKFQYELPQLSKSFLSFTGNNEFEKMTKTNLTESQRQMINDILFQILLFFSVQKFTFDDYVLLVSYLSNSQSSDLISNIKKLLLQMIILKPSPLESVFENNTALSKLHQVFINDPKSTSIEAIESTIEIIVFLHKASMIHGNQIITSIVTNPPSFSPSSFITKFSFSSLKTVNLHEFSLTDHLYTIMQQIPKEIFEKRDFFNRLVDLTEKASPEIFPFSCWSALCIMSSLSNNQEKEERKEMLFSIFKNIEPSNEFVTPHWSLLPVLLAIKVNEKTFASKMLYFLIDCCKGDEWAGIFFTINTLCKVFHVNAMKFQRIFLLKILNSAVQKKEQNGTINEILVNITSTYIFYRDIEYDNISKFFVESPFKLPKNNTKILTETTTTNKKKDEKGKEININSNFLTFNPSTTICDFISQITQIDLNSIKTIQHFGLRFHKGSCKWIDLDIATLLLRYISSNQNNESINYLRLILIYFILHQNEDPKFITSLIKNLDKPQIINSNNDNNNNNVNNNNCVFGLLNDSYDYLHMKRQDLLQILIDLVCFQIEQIGLSNICPLFSNKSENFRSNRNHFFNIISLVFDDKEMLDYFFSSNSFFSKRIQEISSEIIKLSKLRQSLPSFASSLDQQQQLILLPFFDSSCIQKTDASKIFEISQMETIVNKINDMYKYKHSFKDLFESITTTNGPLYTLNKFKRNENCLITKRDKTLVAQFLPLRMKTTWVFNDHKEALLTTKTEPEPNKNTTIKVRESTIQFSEQNNNNKNSSKIPSLSMNDSSSSTSSSQNVPLKNAGSRVRRISTLMKKRLMLSGSSCFVNFDSDIVKKNCEIVSIDKTENALLTLNSSMIKILKLKNFKQFRINYSEMKRVSKTAYLHKPISLQIINVNGREFFLNFETNEIRDSLFNFITTRTGSKSISFIDQIERSTRFWLEEKMTNFEYLLLINMASGRSFQNSSQYPIFPLIFTIYDRKVSNNLTPFNSSFILSNSKFYRDLSKPSGALDETKFERLKKNFDILKKVEMKTQKTNQPSSAFLFSTGASNPQILYGEMARIEPFLSLFITLQGGKINTDSNYSLLNSIPSLFDGVLHDMTDFRELSPEFFSISPEFLEKPDAEIENEIKFGDVELPPWFSYNNSSSCLSAEFLYLHRKALESSFVRSNLNKWIDLMFGCSQRVDGNVYESSLYEEAWNYRIPEVRNKLTLKLNLSPNNQNKKIGSNNNNNNNKSANLLNDEIVIAKELEASKRVLGQVPLKIFEKAHPQCQTTQKSVKIGLNKTNNNNNNNTNISIEKVANRSISSPIGAVDSSSSKHQLKKLSKAREAEDNGRQSKPSAKFAKSRSSSLISTSAIKQLASESQQNQQVKDANQRQIDISETKKKMFGTMDVMDDKARKKRANKDKLNRDQLFDIKRVELKKCSLLYATVYSAASKSIKIHSIDKNGSRFLFVVDVATLDVTFSRNFSGELVKTAANTSSQAASTTSSSSCDSLNKDSILSIASFRDCLLVVMRDKTLLLDSDGKKAINGHLLDFDSDQCQESKEGKEENRVSQSEPDLRLKRYKKVAHDSECLVAVGGDSVIDFFKGKSAHQDASKSAASSISSTSSPIQFSNAASADDSDGLIQNSPLNLTLKNSNHPENSVLLSDSSLSFTQPYGGAIGFTFTDTLMVLQRPHRSFHFFNEHEITCLAVSAFLNSLAVGSSDGRILLFSLFVGSTIVEVKLPVGFVAKKIVFTKSLGLLVVLGIKRKNDEKGEIVGEKIDLNDQMDIYSLFVYTINGQLVRRRAMPIGDKGVSQMAPFLSKKGIDYIALVSANNNAIHICEAFLLDFESHSPPQLPELATQSQKNSNESGIKIEDIETKNEVDSPLVLDQNSNENVNMDSNVNSRSCSEEDLISAQLATPFPSLFRFDDELVYLGYKRKLSSLLYITTGGELGLIPVNKLVDEQF